MLPHISAVISACIVLIAVVGYLRLFLKRKKRRVLRDKHVHTEKRKIAGQTIDRLEEAFLRWKKSGPDRKEPIAPVLQCASNPVRHGRGCSVVDGQKVPIRGTRWRTAARGIES